MSTNNYTINNGTGLSLRTALNTVIGKIENNNSSSTVPDTADSAVGKLWFDTDTATLKVCTDVNLPTYTSLGGSGGGSTTLLNLTDTPGTFGTAGQVLKVNAGGTAVEWGDDDNSGGGSSTLVSLTDTPAGFGTVGQVLKVNASADGVEWADDTSGGSSVTLDSTATSGNTTNAVSSDGLFTALASKSSTSHDHTGVYSDANHAHTGVYSDASHTHATTDLSDTPVALGTAGQILKMNAGANALEWSSDLTASGAGISLTDLSVSTNVASGNGALTYDNSNGTFSFTPADASSGGAGIALTDLSVAANATASGSGGIAYDSSTGVFTFTPAVSSGGSVGNSKTYGTYDSFSTFPVPLGTTSITITLVAGGGGGGQGDDFFAGGNGGQGSCFTKTFTSTDGLSDGTVIKLQEIGAGGQEAQSGIGTEVKILWDVASGSSPESYTCLPGTGGGNAAGSAGTNGTVGTVTHLDQNFSSLSSPVHDTSLVSLGGTGGKGTLESFPSGGENTGSDGLVKIEWS